MSTQVNGNGTRRARHETGRRWSVRVDAQSHMVGCSPLLLGAIEVARQVAATALPVLIVGETGTGKELLARYIHRLSGRAGSLVDVDCGALPGELIEAHLFGHRRGAFTGAIASAEGMIERADRGTLFLDELGSLPLPGQAKLLRALETGEVRRVGDTQPFSVDFRVIATMLDGASARLRDGSFRLDLMQRVAGAVIRIPSLAERPGDVLPLAHHFAEQAGLSVEDDAGALLVDREWTGNVRELRWTIERAVLFARSGVVDATALSAALASGPAALLHRPVSRSQRTTELRAACRAHRGDPERVADALGIGRSTLYRWLKAAGLELRAFKEPAVS